MSGSKTAVLISVGGSPAPVRHVLESHRSDYVWYFCSVESRAAADEIQARLEWKPQARFLVADRFEELGPCYSVLLRKIPEILEETGVRPSNVLVDYTGGTKTMSAALVLFASEIFQQFSYVGGEQREKGGLGIVLDGRERVLYQDNPWSALAIREVERASDLWNGRQYGAAANMLREVAEKTPWPMRFQAVADLAAATAARHRLDFRAAKGLLRPLQGRLIPLFEGRNDFGVIDFARTSLEVCESCTVEKANDNLLRELLDNALRTAAQQRWEDAAARLYRAMEMQGQIWLTEMTNGAFENGRCKGEVPEALRELPFCQPSERGDVKLASEQCFRALAVLGHEPSVRLIVDLDAVNDEGKPASRWRNATDMRNSSILAHGSRAISEEGFARMKEIASDFLGFDLTREAKPFPAFEARWLESP